MVEDFDRNALIVQEIAKIKERNILVLSDRIEHLNTIVLTMPISFSGRMVQYLGRIGRRGQECLAIDFVDEQVLMLKSSFGKRAKGYKQMGYREVKRDSLNLFKI